MIWNSGHGATFAMSLGWISHRKYKPSSSPRPPKRTPPRLPSEHRRETTKETRPCSKSSFVGAFMFWLTWRSGVESVSNLLDDAMGEVHDKAKWGGFCFAAGLDELGRPELYWPALGCSVTERHLTR